MDHWWFHSHPECRIEYKRASQWYDDDWSETNPKQLYTSRLAVWFIVSIDDQTKENFVETDKKEEKNML